MENWKRIDSSPAYEVSDLGRVRHAVTHKFVKLTPHHLRGYLRVPFGTIRFVHRLVAMAFLPPDPTRITVNHNNGKNTDNRAINLMWHSWAENNAHSAHMRIASNNPKRAFKLTKAKAAKIKKLKAAGSRTTDVARQFGVSESMVRHIVNGKFWKEA